MKFFHYCFENHPGEGTIVRLNDRRVAIEVPDLAHGATTHVISVDRRDQRVLVVIGGELLWDSIPKAGDVIQSLKIGERTTNIEHVRLPRFGTPSYRIEMEEEKWVAKVDLILHFLLLPAGNAMFRRFRDTRSLGPMYVFAEVRKSETGPSVVWRNSTY